jgi:uncharacterized protein HemX
MANRQSGLSCTPECTDEKHSALCLIGAINASIKALEALPYEQRGGVILTLGMLSGNIMRLERDAEERT